MLSHSHQILIMKQLDCCDKIMFSKQANSIVIFMIFMSTYYRSTVAYQIGMKIIEDIKLFSQIKALS